MKKVGVLNFSAICWKTMVADCVSHKFSWDGYNEFHMPHWRRVIKILYGEDSVEGVSWEVCPQGGLGHHELKYLSTVDLNVVNNFLINEEEARIKTIEEEKAKIKKKDRELAIGYKVKWTKMDISSFPNTWYIPSSIVQSEPIPIAIEDVDADALEIVRSTNARRLETYQWASFF